MTRLGRPPLAKEDRMELVLRVMVNRRLRAAFKMAAARDALPLGVWARRVLTKAASR